jgi:hypothetical protein
MIKAFWSKTVQVLAIAGAVFTLKTAKTSGQVFDSSQEGEQRSPLACNTLALSSEERAQHFNEVGRLYSRSRRAFANWKTGMSLNSRVIGQRFSC